MYATKQNFSVKKQIFVLYLTGLTEILLYTLFKYIQSGKFATYLVFISILGQCYSKSTNMSNEIFIYISSQ